LARGSIDGDRCPPDPVLVTEMDQERARIMLHAKTVAGILLLVETSDRLAS